MTQNGKSVRVNVRFVWGAFVVCCFAFGCVLELVVSRVRFARVSCPRLRLRKSRNYETDSSHSRAAPSRAAAED